MEGNFLPWIFTRRSAINTITCYRKIILEAEIIKANEKKFSQNVKPLHCIKREMNRARQRVNVAKVKFRSKRQKKKPGNTSMCIITELINYKNKLKKIMKTILNRKLD